MAKTFLFADCDTNTTTHESGWQFSLTSSPPTALTAYKK